MTYKTSVEMAKISEENKDSRFIEIMTYIEMTAIKGESEHFVFEKGFPYKERLEKLGYKVELVDLKKISEINENQFKISW